MALMVVGALEQQEGSNSVVEVVASPIIGDDVRVGEYLSWKIERMDR